ncbi:hypothetical protein E7744_10565 [Citricoccus sp. SGAir0253]|uniref:S-layer homology domain-containing protein n=1 Tax=Citricoccus sp. SGAir0253 TaxID=2567881 RepID=UPI0010CCF5C1|nr:S-layer homology domain-containing protein [Citricoccus sp. SGAir0253]QCU78547.1 hypothetical protein E7744_10565 [Citricoccus sp. SGAir0253]
MSRALLPSVPPARRPRARRPFRASLAARALVPLLAAGTVLAGTGYAAPPAHAATYCGTRDFTDVPRGSTFYAAISWLTCEGITTGYQDGSFGVSRTITRAELATMLYRQVDPSHPRDGKQYFRDVRAGAYYTDAVNWMAQSGLSTGYADGTFRPTQSITRGEVSALLYRLSGSTYAGPATSPFRDIRRGDTFYAAATWMLAKGLVSGYADWTFRPDRPITRGETAKMLKNSNPYVAGRGDVSYSAVAPLPSAGTTPTWAVTAARWATAKANDARVSYEWGGNGPYEYDCSGFTIGAFGTAGKSLPRRAHDQYRAAKDYVPLSQVRVGDLVYWSNGSTVYHVAMYIGDGKIAHARNEQMGVAVTSLQYSPTNMLAVAGRY